MPVRRLHGVRRGQSVGMSGHDEHEVANPDRTQVDGDVDAQPAPARQDEHDPHDQPWPEVAGEVKRAVRDADGPLA